MIRRIRTTLLAMAALTVIFLTVTVLVSIQAKAIGGRQLELVHVVSCSLNNNNYLHLHVYNIVQSSNNNLYTKINMTELYMC